MNLDSSELMMYRVVVNREGQYTNWPANLNMPQGWDDAGKVGTKAECLDHIKTVWTDMRPLHLRT